MFIYMLYTYTTIRRFSRLKSSILIMSKILNKHDMFSGFVLL